MLLRKARHVRLFTILCAARPTSVAQRRIRLKRKPFSTSSNSPQKNLVPTPPKTSFLVPLAKSLGCLLAFGVVVRFARPLTLLMSKPIVTAGMSYGALAAVFRKYGNHSWGKSFALSSCVILLGGGAYAYHVASEEMASFNLTPMKESVLLSEAVLLIEAACGNSIRADTTGGTRTKGVHDTLDTNAQGECISTQAMPVSNLYVNGGLYKGTAVVQMKYSGVLLKEWVLDTVHVDVKVSPDKQIRSQIYPKAPELAKESSVLSNQFQRKGSLFLSGTQSNGHFKVHGNTCKQDQKEM